MGVRDWGVDVVDIVEELPRVHAVGVRAELRALADAADGVEQNVQTLLDILLLERRVAVPAETLNQVGGRDRAPVGRLQPREEPLELQREAERRLRGIVGVPSPREHRLSKLEAHVQRLQQAVEITRRALVAQPDEAVLALGHELVEGSHAPRCASDPIREALRLGGLARLVNVFLAAGQSRGQGVRVHGGVAASLMSALSLDRKTAEGRRDCLENTKIPTSHS